MKSQMKLKFTIVRKRLRAASSPLFDFIVVFMLVSTLKSGIK